MRLEDGRAEGQLLDESPKDPPDLLLQDVTWGRAVLRGPKKTCPVVLGGSRA